MIQYSLSWVYDQKKMKTLIQKDTHAPVSRSTVYICQEMKATCVSSTGEWMQKLCVYICVSSSVWAHTHTLRYLLSHKSI